MNPPPSSRGPRAGRRRDLLRRVVSLAQGSPRRSTAVPVGLMALVLMMGHGTALEANEDASVRRGGEVGQFDPVPIDSLPVHRPSQKSESEVSSNSQSTRYSEGTPRILRGELSRGESISTQLRAQGISAQMVRMIDRGIRPEFDFRRLIVARDPHLLRRRLLRAGSRCSRQVARHPHVSGPSALQQRDRRMSGCFW